MAATVELGNAELLAIFNDPSVTYRVCLAKNEIDAQAQGVSLASLVPCDFPGYAPVVNPQWDEVTYDAQENPEIVAKGVTWTADGLIVPQAVHAVYVTKQEGGELPILCAIRILDKPFLFLQDGDIFKQEVSVFADLDI